jgi:hypothetical protein
MSDPAPVSAPSATTATALAAVRRLSFATLAADGLSGESIPIGSRIILACDAYNAMITARPYRDPMSHEEALAELERGAGAQFDPHVVEALLRVLALRGPVYPAAASPGATTPDS